MLARRCDGFDPPSRIGPTAGQDCSQRRPARSGQSRVVGAGEGGYRVEDLRVPVPLVLHGGESGVAEATFGRFHGELVLSREKAAAERVVEHRG
jgi:hypothetical protein